jgi:hypothetical protein
MRHQSYTVPVHPTSQVSQRATPAKCRDLRNEAVQPPNFFLCSKLTVVHNVVILSSIGCVNLISHLLHFRIIKQVRPYRTQAQNESGHYPYCPVSIPTWTMTSYLHRNRGEVVVEAYPTWTSCSNTHPSRLQGHRILLLVGVLPVAICKTAMTHLRHSAWPP